MIRQYDSPTDHAIVFVSDRFAPDAGLVLYTPDRHAATPDFFVMEYRGGYNRISTQWNQHVRSVTVYTKNTYDEVSAPLIIDNMMGCVGYRGQFFRIATTTCYKPDASPIFGLRLRDHRAVYTLQIGDQLLAYVLIVANPGHDTPVVFVADVPSR